MTQTQPQSQSQPADIGRTAWRIFLLQQVNLFTSLPCAIYIVLLIARIPQEQAVVAISPIPVFALVCGVGLPLWLVHLQTRRAFAFRPDDPPGARLVRLLKLPRALEVSILTVYITGNSAYLLWLALRLNKPLYIVPWGSGVILVMMMLVMIWTRVFLERLLMPHALEEFFKHPEANLPGARGLLWPKQSWYLPYCFALFVLCTVFALGSILTQMGMNLYGEVAASIPPDVLVTVNKSLAGFLDNISLPLVLVSLYMLITSASAAWLLTQQQERGFRAVQDSIEGFATGQPVIAPWVTTDETGDLARSTARAFHQLRQFALALDRTATKLGTSARQLEQSNSVQNQSLTRQAAALEEAQVTVQEIHQTSQTTAQKAEGFLYQTGRIEEISSKGEATIQQSLHGLEEIRSQVELMALSIRNLSELTRELDSITRVVKELADRSNMLAVNAAIEAVRSGEHGKGFGVVAREIRTMSDQSVKATNNVRDMLTNLSQSIRDAVELTERGVDKVNSNVEQVKATGDNMRTLTSIMKESISAVRQISVTVSQQGVGVQQIFQAIKDLNQLMEGTLQQLGDLSTVTHSVGETSTEVHLLISQHGWQSTAQGEQEPAAEGSPRPADK
ncbi:methyl-accepting chemotaxis protein [Cystobacter fuscus DSM 2262]|uniref:Methyl-accepting chemotaxis protein n=1 Tax=Cystobacter fuscus (strain ATCC 25194 / DSM 2262 / NBRC 100088 / M29) TaxID=1242864 RepID=S9NY75_CYSF2|nr:methyl-accepting chemotaxis protein [Cystobacter fuscus]EPX55851.1 methyl-accepting chemotaxis protein [Cystobacter fuscus DSM 2262]